MKIFSTDYSGRRSFIEWEPEDGEAVLKILRANYFRPHINAKSFGPMLYHQAQEEITRVISKL